ncbi:hypothetical protein BDP27DRAFT_1239744 [Rhodocollybia butyracea]|uniref:Uncharacterized protein n=1 Tax=Rhodocollybia butyracea TaxID=206335 RepID=A0A9P5P8M6_9AGAR|nr:hypothetical protein BDP27DRAFT_1239744 [Rhodocollybia butyracea]
MAAQSNPLHTARNIVSAPNTNTVPSRLAFHEAHAALRPILAGIQTEDDLGELIDQLHEIRDRGDEERRMETLNDPPIYNPKGRPRTQRLTAAHEGRPRGGGQKSESRYRAEVWGMSSGRSYTAKLPVAAAMWARLGVGQWFQTVTVLVIAAIFW